MESGEWKVERTHHHPALPLKGRGGKGVVIFLLYEREDEVMPEGDGVSEGRDGCAGNLERNDQF